MESLFGATAKVYSRSMRPTLSNNHVVTSFRSNLDAITLSIIKICLIAFLLPNLRFRWLLGWIFKILDVPTQIPILIFSL